AMIEIGAGAGFSPQTMIEQGGGVDALIRVDGAGCFGSLADETCLIVARARGMATLGPNGVDFVDFSFESLGAEIPLTDDEALKFGFSALNVNYSRDVQLDMGHNVRLT